MSHTWPQRWVTTTLLLATILIQRAVTIKNTFNPGMTDKKILDELFKDIRYDRRMRPEEVPRMPLESGEQPNVTQVNVNVVILSLISPDESSITYKTEFLLHQQWVDTRLAFSITGHEHDYLNGNHHEEKIWIPDTYFFTHGDFKKLDLPYNKALRIYQNGTIVYTQRRRLSLSCEGDLTIFPFDDPRCSFTVESNTYEARELVYNWKKESTIQPLHFQKDMHLLNAYMKQNKTEHCDQQRVAWRGNYSCLIVELTFTRDKPFYFSTVFIPGMLLVSSAFITFWLEWNAVPGRVMLGVTTMLNFFTTSNNFRSSLPVVSNLTAMNVWDGVCMCFIYASLLEFVAVNYLGRKKPRAPRMYRPASTTVTVRQNDKGEQVGNHDSFTCTSCPPNKCTHVDRISISPQDSQKVRFFEMAHPLRVAKTIDVVSRVVFPVTYGVFLIFFFIKFNGIS